MKIYKLVVGLFILSSLTVFSVEAQVTIGSGFPPVEGALLQLKENDDLGKNSSKGLILPRVYLSNKNNLYPMFSSPNNNNLPNSDYANQAYKAEQDKLHVGMVVYNTNPNAPFAVGIFVWNGQEWLSIPKNTTRSTSIITQ